MFLINKLFSEKAYISYERIGAVIIRGFGEVTLVKGDGELVKLTQQKCLIGNGVVPPKWNTRERGISSA